MNIQSLFTGLILTLQGCTGAVIVIIDAANAAGFSEQELISWLSMVYFLGGLISIILSFVYKIPLVGAHSLAGAVFLATSAAAFPFPVLIGSYILVGLCIFLIGATGIFDKLMNIIPRPMIAAMLAGLVLNYVAKVVPAFKEIPIVAIVAMVGFFLTAKLTKKISPIMGVLLFGIIAFAVTSPISGSYRGDFILPEMGIPTFSLLGFISITIPLAILILSNDSAVAFAASKQNGYQPPISRALMISGLGTSFAGFFGGHAVGVGGMATALSSSEEAGPKEKRYWAAIVTGAGFMFFGIFAWAIIGLIELLPGAFISFIAGFSLIGVLISSAHTAFSESDYRFSTIFTFVIAMSNVSFLGIASPAWSLIIGVLTAKLLNEGTPKFERNLDIKKAGNVSST